MLTYYAFAYFNYFANFIALFLQKPKISPKSKIILLVFYFILAPILISDGSIEILCYSIGFLIICIVNENSFSDSLKYVLTANTYLYLASKLNSLLSHYFPILLEHLDLYFIISFITLYVVHILLSVPTNILMTIYPKFNRWLFVPHAFLYFYVLYQYTSTYLFDFILLEEFQQIFFRNIFLVLSIIFVLSSVLVNITIINIQKIERDKNKQILNEQIFHYLKNQTLSSRLFIHDQIKMLTTLENLLNSIDNTEHIIKEHFLPLKNEIQAHDHSLLSVVYLEPLTIQYYLYNKLIYVQQLNIECHIEIAEKILFHGNNIELIHLLDLIIDQSVRLTRNHIQPLLQLVIIKEMTSIVFIITVNSHRSNVALDSKIKECLIESNEILLHVSHKEEKQQIEWTISVQNDTR